MKKIITLVTLLALFLVVGPTFTGSVEAAGICRVPKDYATIQEAVDDENCGTIFVSRGEWFGAEVTRAVRIVGLGRAVINDGPNSHSFLRAGFLFADDYSGSGTVISGFTFEGSPQFDYVDDEKLDFPVFSRGANNVTIRSNVFKNSLQAVSNWGGSGWKISHNKIEDLWTLNGGGIGVLIGDRNGGMVKDNLVSFNKIGGTLVVYPDDGGGYNGTGVALYADFRWGALGAEEVSGNRVVHNRVNLVSDTPEVVDVAAVELTDTRDDETLDPVIFGNKVKFNDLRGMELQIDLTPDNLDEHNDISRNLGENRGWGWGSKSFTP